MHLWHPGNPPSASFPGCFLRFRVFSGSRFPVRSPFAKRSDFGPILDRFSWSSSMNQSPSSHPRLSRQAFNLCLTHYGNLGFPCEQHFPRFEPLVSLRGYGPDSSQAAEELWPRIARSATDPGNPRSINVLGCGFATPRTSRVRASCPVCAFRAAHLCNRPAWTGIREGKAGGTPARRWFMTAEPRDGLVHELGRA